MEGKRLDYWKMLVVLSFAILLCYHSEASEFFNHASYFIILTNRFDVHLIYHGCGDKRRNV